MRTQIVKTLFIAVFAFASSCQKTTQNERPFNQLNAKEQKAVIQTLSNDSDWKLIATANMNFMSKVVSSNIDITKVDMQNQDDFLKKIGVDKKGYLETISKIQIASNRLLEKYKVLKLYNEEANCISCKETQSFKMIQFQNLVIKFQTNPKLLQNANQLLLHSFAAGTDSGNSIENSESTDADNLCCPFSFYACASVCAATIPVFPAYLACCYLCGLEFCCDAWPGK